MRITDVPKEHREVYLSNGIDDSIKEIITYNNDINSDELIEVVIRGKQFIDFLYTCGYLDGDSINVKDIFIKTI